jgi:beta-alanine--pyruvate transaminase
MSQDALLSNELDLSAYWMPFTANRQFKANPRIFTGAGRMHYISADGRKVLDGTAGLWCVGALKSPRLSSGRF